MATRAMIAFLDDDKQLVTTYNHYDGYPEYLGKVLNKFYNDERAAEELAGEGYISYLDIDTGEINAKNQDEPGYKVIDADDAFTAGMMIGDEVKGMGADYGYVWIKELGKWYVLKNKGGDSMAKQIEDVLGDSGMYMVDENKNEKDDIMEQGYEAKWAKFLNESPALFNQNPDFNVLKKYLQQSGDYEDGSLDFAIDGYIEAVKRDFEAGGTRRSDYDDYEMDDYVEDFDNWFTEKMDS